MASSHNPHNEPDHGEDDQDDTYLDEDDILDVLEVDGNGDEMMDDDEADEMDDDVGDLPGAGPSSEPYVDTSLRRFEEHGKSVFAVAAHPTAPIAVSGGEDDLGYIWSLDTGATLVRLSGHTDSVAAVQFSVDGEMVATGGMDGKVRVWRRVGTDGWDKWEFLTELQGPDEVLWLQWHPKGSVLVAGANDTTVWLWQLPSGNTMQVFAGHSGPVHAGTFTPDGKRLLTADGDGTLLFWDPRQAGPVFKLTSTDPRFDLDGITSLAVNASSTLAVIGGAAGGVRVVSLLKGEVVGALAGHDEDASVEAVTFIDLASATSGPGVAVTGATDGKAHVWDLSTSRLRATLKHEDAVTSLTAHPTKPYLLVSASADSHLRTWDARTGALVQEHQGHLAPVMGAALAMEGKLIVSAGDDGVCLVYNTE